MPSNPDKDKRLCRVHIDKILTSGLKQVKSILYTDLVRDVLLNFNVSEHFVEKFIKKYYIETGIVIYKNGVLSIDDSKEG